MNIEEYPRIKNENEVKRIKERAERIHSIILEFGSQQEICSKIGACNYVVNQLKNPLAKGIESIESIQEANGYITLFCEKYPLACELNMGELESARGNR